MVIATDRVALRTLVDAFVFTRHECPCCLQLLFSLTVPHYKGPKDREAAGETVERMSVALNADFRSTKRQTNFVGFKAILRHK